MIDHPVGTELNDENENAIPLASPLPPCSSLGTAYEGQPFEGHPQGAELNDGKEVPTLLGLPTFLYRDLKTIPARRVLASPWVCLSHVMAAHT